MSLKSILSASALAFALLAAGGASASSLFDAVDEVRYRTPAPDEAADEVARLPGACGGRDADPCARGPVDRVAHVLDPLVVWVANVGTDPAGRTAEEATGLVDFITRFATNTAHWMTARLPL